MSQYQHIKVEEKIGRVDIVLNTPPLNILTIAMMEEICDAVEKASGDRSLRALVFKSEGKHFSVGADVSEHTEEMVEAMIEVFGRMFRYISEFPGITVAAVDGSALGGGCELATFCDIVLASDRAKFGQPEIQVGVFPPVAVVILPHLMGRNRALELIASGRVISAEEAERMGLVNHVFLSIEFPLEVNKFVSGITAQSAAVIAVTKKTLDRCMFLPVREALRKADETYLDELMRLDDAHEGLAAFLEKRKAEWKNR